MNVDIKIIIFRINKSVPLHAMEAVEGKRVYSSYSFLTSVLDEGEWAGSKG
jgi:hypothetical protein